MKKRIVAIYVLTALVLAPSLGVLFPWVSTIVPTAFCFIVPADGPPFSEGLLPLFGMLSTFLGLIALIRYAVSKSGATRLLRCFAWMQIVYAGLASLFWVILFVSRFLKHFPITDIRFYLLFACSLLPHVVWLLLLRWCDRQLRRVSSPENDANPGGLVTGPANKRPLAFLLCPALAVLVIAAAASFKPRSPIHEAVASGRVEDVKAMLRKDPSLATKVPMYNGFDPLPTIAIKNNDTNMLREVLVAGARVDQEDEFGETPLLTAIHMHNIPAINLLIAHGASVNRGRGGYINPLIEAARSSDEEVLKALLDAGADVNVTNLAYRGMSQDVILTTPLKVAAERGDAAAVHLLLERGAVVNQKGPNDDAAINEAYGSIPVLTLLLAAGANVNEKGYEDKTPLHAAAGGRLLYNPQTQKNFYEPVGTNVVAYLLANGADPNARDRSGLTPLAYAEKHGHDKIAEILRSVQSEIR